MRLNSGLATILALIVCACGGGSGGGSASTLAPPTQLTASAAGQDQIVITWTAPAGSFDGYELEGSISPNPFEKLHTGLISSEYIGARLTFSPTDPDNALFKFRVRTARGTSFSPYSNEASYLRGPNAPTQITAVYDWSEARVILNWTRNTTGSDGLSIERAECNSDGAPNGGWSALTVTDPFASTFVDADIAPDRYYTYRISNLAGGQTSQPCTLSKPVFTGLASVSWVSAYYDSALGGIQVSWSASTPIPDGVRLERSDCGANGVPLGNWIVLSLPAGYQTSLLDQSAQEGGTYAYRATNLYGQTTSTPYQMNYGVTIPLLAPINLQVAPVAGGLQLTWQNRSQAATQVVLRRTPFIGISSDIAILSPSTSGFLDSTTNLGYYTYTVLAKTNNLEASSNQAAAATPNPSDALALTATALNYPNASDAALRHTGTWSFASSSPFEVLSNNDPWPALFPSNVSQWSIPIVQVDRQGWPHVLYASPNTATAGESTLNHMWYEGATWKSEVIANSKIPLNSFNPGWTFQLDSRGNPNVLLDHTMSEFPYNSSTSTLSYLHKVDGAWTEEPLTVLSPSINFFGSYHIKLDNSDTPHILLGIMTTVIDYTRTDQGVWSSSTLPTGSVIAGPTNFLDSIWIDGRNGWIFYEDYVTGNGLVYGLYVIQMKEGAWQPAELLGVRAPDGAITNAQAAISPDRTRVAVAYNTSAGLKAYHQTVSGWHQTLVAPPAGGYSLLRIGFDGNQSAHILTATSTGFVDYHE